MLGAMLKSSRENKGEQSRRIAIRFTMGKRFQRWLVGIEIRPVRKEGTIFLSGILIDDCCHVWREFLLAWSVL